MSTNRPPNWEEIADQFARLVVTAMATYVVTTDKVPDFRDWIRTEMLPDIVESGDDPEVLDMFQKIGNAPDRIIESTVEVFTWSSRNDLRSQMKRSGLSWLLGPN